MVNNMIERQAAIMDDLISRQAAIEELRRMMIALYRYDATAVISCAIYKLQNLPSAEPNHKMGKWIHDGYDHPHGVDWMHCSECGKRDAYLPATMTNYCPNCGAEMVKGEEDVRKSD